MSDIKSIPENNGKFRQFLAAITVNLVSVSFGISCGWPSPVIPQLKSNNPPVGDTPMSEEQISWISSLLPIGSLLIIAFCGILTERLGRKNFSYLAGLAHVISWSLIIFGENHICVYAARLIIGMGSAMTVFIVPMYVSEIASEDVRGILGSLLLFSANVGVLFAYIAGAYLSYRLFASLSLLFPLVFVVAFFFMPETPVYLVRRNRQLQAHKSLMFLRGNNRALVEQELAKLQSQAIDSHSESKTIGLSHMFKDRATRKGLIISFGLLGGQQLSGILAMLSYAGTIFQRAGSSISPDTAAIIIGVIQIVGSYTSTMLMERAGRRLLALISCFGMAISHALVGLFFYLHQNKYDVSSITWLPLVGLSTYVITYCLGMGGVPFVVTSEVFRVDVSSFATTLSYLFFWAVCFTAVKTFGPAMKHLGADGCFFVLATFCVACFVFCYFLLPETKGRQRDDIVAELAGINRSSHEKTHAIDKSVDSKDYLKAQQV